jgi:hypothetical protein
MVGLARVVFRLADLALRAGPRRKDRPAGFVEPRGGRALEAASASRAVVNISWQIIDTFEDARVAPRVGRIACASRPEYNSLGASLSVAGAKLLEFVPAPIDRAMWIKAKIT